jgi:hypothetical protein
MKTYIGITAIIIMLSQSAFARSTGVQLSRNDDPRVNLETESDNRHIEAIKDPSTCLNKNNLALTDDATLTYANNISGRTSHTGSR